MFSQRNAASWAGMLIVTLAAAWTVIHLILGIAGTTATDYWGIALPILFVIALIVAFVRFAQERSALQTASSTERFPPRWRESSVPGLLFRADPTADLLYGVRLTAGGSMAAVSLWWFIRSLQHKDFVHEA